MELTPEMKLAQQELQNLNSQITNAESNLRILERIGSTDVISLRSRLQKAVARRDQVLQAIQIEEERTD